MRSIGGVQLLVASLLACGCDYPVYGFVPDSVDSAPPDGTVVLDGAPDAIDARADSATEDAALGDTGDAAIDSGLDTLAVDTGTDGPTTDSLVTKGCTGSVHVFCADFDSVLTPQTGWTDSNLIGGGTNLLDKSISASPTASYVATIPASPTNTEAGATLNEDFSLASATPLLRAEMLVRLDASTNEQDTLLTKVSHVGSGTGVEIGIGPSGLVMNIVGTASSGTFPLLVPTPNVWFKLKLEVVLAAGTAGSAKAYVDDKLLVTQTGVATASATAANARLVVGVYQSSAPVSAAKANFDDVTFDTL